jgi:beta-xylosidase
MKNSMWKAAKYALFLALILLSGSLSAQKKEYSGNPIFPGWYADPEAKIFGNEYWVYPTYSAPYHEQVFMDGFSSTDLVHWTKHPHVLDSSAVKWVKKALWAPAITQKDGKYYLFFGANDIHDDTKEIGGIGVAVADKPEGPFKDYLGKPLIGKIYNKAQPIDQFVFKDDDGQY